MTIRGDGNDMKMIDILFYVLYKLKHSNLQAGKEQVSRLKLLHSMYGGRKLLHFVLTHMMC